MSHRRDFIKIPLAATLASVLSLCAWPALAQQPVTLLNVSYDPTRELYVEYNRAFTRHWKARTGQDVSIKQSHGGSGKQARSVIDGSDADVVTLPKTSGGARWNYLAAWEYARRKYGDDAKAREFVGKLYSNVPVLDTGARGSSITFVQRNQGDVFISWENEAYLLEKEFGGKVDFVYPSLSILAEPPVTVVDRNVDKKGTRAVAEEYLKFLYSEEAQDIIGKHFYRPTSAKAQAQYARQLPRLNLFTIDQAFGGWEKAARDHFADGAAFDQIYTRK